MLNITNLSDFDLQEKKSIIIVPESYSHNYERFLCEKYSNTASKNAEVLTFSRISDRIFAEIGGFANNYINDSGRILAMYNAINSVFPMLKIYNSNKIDIITRILAIIDEFKMYKIAENDILNASTKLTGNIKNKLMDLYYIYSAYNKITENEIRDPREEIEFLCENFHKCTIYDNFNVYFDKFDAFTPQQYALISEFLKKNINVTIVLDVKENKDKIYDLSTTSKDTLINLKIMAKRHKFDINFNFIEKKAEKFDEIIENIFEYEKISLKDNDINLHISTTIQNECMRTAGEIINIVKNSKNLRYSDIVVTARNFNLYQGQLEVAFRRFNIPLFVAKKEDIMKKVPVKTIISALNVILCRYKTQEVFEYLKSPLLDYANNDICQLEDYILRWNVKYIAENTVFTANPSYNLRKVNEDEQEKLDFFNNVKNEVLEPVFRLEKSFKNCKNGSDFIHQLHNFCENIHLGEKILQYESDDINLTQQFHQIWDAIISSFEQFFEISGNQEMSIDEFIKLYKTLISSYSVAEIPSSIDNVTAGGFERVVGEKCGILFILGADADNFPAKVSENPILNDKDREELEDLDINMSPYGNFLVIREYELIAKIISIAKNKIYMSYSEVTENNNSPSSIFMRIKDIISNIEITTDSSVEYEFMYKSEKTALEYLAMNKNTVEIEKLKPEIIENRNKNIIKEEVMREIYSKYLSPSRIDVQISCQFKYFMQYGLKVKPRKIMEFNQADNGNFIHYILENVLENSAYESDFTGEINKYIEKYVEEYFSDNMREQPKFEYILTNLKKNTYKIVGNIIREIQDSEFKPCEFELEISEKSQVKPLKIGDFSIIGKVDRVDVYSDGENKHLRIIDYKSGVKKLDLSTFYHGINMQMFIYLLALEKDKSKYEEMVASGALYVPTKIPKISSDKPISKEEMPEIIDKNLRRSGLVVENMQIIQKMEKNNPFVYLPIKIKKDNTINSSVVTSSDNFTFVKEFVEEKLKEITSELMSGEVEPNPYTYKNKSPCDYCDFINCCGFSVNYDKKREINDIKDEEFWEKMKK